MKFAVDLHIHSALSPCGDKDMTPNNILNMSYIKGLDIISVTDHNTMLNVEAVMSLGKERDILVIPGIEVTTKEEVHVLCYFDSLKKGMEFSKIIYDSLPNIENNPETFGRQMILDVNDNCVGELEKLLLSSTPYSIKDVHNMVNDYNGIMIPAHIDKATYSIMSTLGFIPMDLSISSVEVSKRFIDTKNDIFKIEEYKLIKNSDAHYLKDINEREFFIYPKDKSITGVLDWLSKMED